MRDINNNEIAVNSIVKDLNDKQYLIVEKNNSPLWLNPLND